MPLSKKRQYRYPSSKSGPDLAAHLTALAEDVDLDVDGVEKRSQESALALTETLEDVEAKLPSPAYEPRYVRGWADREGNLALGITPEGTVHAPALDAELFNGLTVERLDPKLTGLLYGLADSKGRLAEPFAVGLDGRFPQWVIDSIGSRLSITAPAPGSGSGTKAPAIVAPSPLYLLAGETYTMHHSGMIQDLAPGQWVRLGGSSGYYGNRWELAPEAGSFSLALEVVNPDGSTAASKLLPVQVSRKPSTAPCLLAIGDSITLHAGYVRAAVAALGGKAVGTRTKDDGTTGHEGRGGWSLDSYFSRSAREDGEDSPFLFPTGVEGRSYKGNTEFWKRVVLTDPQGYAYAGYQKVGRDWTGSVSAYGPDGYPLNPAAGDVVVDPTRAEGSKFRRYANGAWSAMSPQPAGWEFSFPKYMSRFSAVYAAAGAPNVISIMLGTNDFGRAMTPSSLAGWKVRMDQLVASVRAWSDSVRVVLVSPPTGAPQDKWAATPYGQTHAADFDRRMRDFSAWLSVNYGTRQAEGIYMAAATAAVSPANFTDWVHPDESGHRQLGPVIAGAVAKSLGV